MTIAPTGLIYISEGFYARTVSQQGQVLTLGYGFGPNDVVLAAAPDNTLYGSQTDYSSVHVPVSIVQRRLTGEVIRSEALEWNQYVLSMIVARNNAIYILASTASGDRLYKITDSKIYPVALAPVTLVRREKATYGVQVDAIQYSGAYDRLAVAADGTVYIAGQHQIWKVTPGGTLSILAGSTEAGYEDGPAAQARFQQIFALELADNDGVLYVSDDFRIRRIMLK
ncbi:hypothetical protein [Mucilaginibacter aquariorum]|uniref:Uncharacterized protein n=1 Tax=Mucilaginibacter aquariorum TaxID=2967225 RepID=A0ABT1T3L6_9SPHI|nr:hypothetical protein [Mucilaginibacter aquariorum]MCQ6959200.1 hypothetical protein [Mucilaginibacter aquariorum]